ncbi:MAG: type II secretion system GspH family protein [Planctomycetaceae bacterium]|nr:type II secretion system GspH family protein [Planctomycetaceae bacterium]
MKNYKSGMTLLEVIASMFIICIGLLSILMVIPYGTFQVSKTLNAEYISNMLAAGAEDLQIGNWDKNITDTAGVGKPPFEPDPVSGTITTNIYIVDPFVSHNDFGLFTRRPNILPNLRDSQDKMRGKDDIEYVLSENQRTYIDNGNEGSGKYSYFITIKPREVRSSPRYNEAEDRYEEAIDEITYTTDLLGCYQRVDTDTAFEVHPTSPQYYAYAAKFTIPSAENKLDFSTTKYVFITWVTNWPDPPSAESQSVTMNRGEWCRVVSAVIKNDNTQDIIVISNDFASVRNNEGSENLPETGNIRIFIFPGVLYHKRIFD